MSLKYLLPALALMGSVSAACSGSSELVIQNEADAQALTSCSTYSGNIAVATSVAGDLSFTGVQKIDGDLSVENNDALTQISAGSLEVITGSFILTELQILDVLDFPALRKVDVVKWVGLPTLSTLQFTATIQEASTVDIENTYLDSMEGFNLEFVDILKIANNPYLKSIEFQLANVTESLTLDNNSNDLEVSFPDLVWANNMTFRNCSEVKTPSLESVDGSLGFYSNFFESYSAPFLTEVDGTLAFVDNGFLTEINLPNLTTVGGGFQIANNSALESVEFPKLATVKGALDFTGEFTDVELPELADVRGAFNIQSTGDIEEQCASFEELTGSGNVIKGLFNCEGQVDDPNSDDSSSDDDDSDESGAAGVLRISRVTVFGLTGLLCSFFNLL